MQSSSRALPFKQTLTGASPATDASCFNAHCPRSSVRLERHRAKVEVASATPAVDTISIYDFEFTIYEPHSITADARESSFLNRKFSIRIVV